MSLATQITSLASRVATEFKTVRTELASGLAGKASTSHTHTLSQITDYVSPTVNVDGGTATTVYGGSTTITGGNASGV